MRIIHVVFIFVVLAYSCDGPQDNKDTSSATNLSDDSYIVENVYIPDSIRAEIGGIDFFEDGKLAVSFLRGEVYIHDPESGNWSLFANGLYEPLGLKIIDEHSIMVMQKPELTLLKDIDGDGKADLYTCLTSDFGLSGNHHEYGYGPVSDDDGNLFIGLNTSTSGKPDNIQARGKVDTFGYNRNGMGSIVPYRGWIMKLDETGNLHPFASGFRSPNGLCFNNGHLLVTDNQGDWVGTSTLYSVKEGNFYGHPASLVWDENNEIEKPFELTPDYLNKIRTKAAVLFPHDIIANSPSEPITDLTNGKFGPFAGQVFVGEMSLSSSKIVRVILEEVNGVLQGACTPFMGEQDNLRIGNNRLAFSPTGDLWVGQAAYGWLGANGLQKIKFTGNTKFDILDISLQSYGFDIEFTKRLSDEIDYKKHISASKYNYEYRAKYGSPRINNEQIMVDSIKVSDNSKILSLFISDLTSEFIYEFNLKSFYDIHGNDLNTVIAYTLNSLRD